MTQHTDLIERLRASSEDGLTPDDAYAAAEALEAQAREIERLRKDAALVAARERERLTSAAMESASKAIDAAVSMTIERCAQLCEAMHEEDRPGDYAYAIRALNTEGEGNDPITG